MEQPGTEPGGMIGGEGQQAQLDKPCRRVVQPMKPIAMFPIAPPLRDDVDQAPVTQQVEAAPGEVELDEVIRAQASAPQVVERLTTLEDCLWAAVDALGKLSASAREILGADAIIDRAKFLLRGDLEIPEKETAEGVEQTTPEETNPDTLN